jgi:hypothetical protein
VLWKGHCSVHTRFSVKQIEHFRATHPTGKVIVHPECTFDVVQAADLRVDRDDHPHGEGQPAGIDLGRRHRNPSREPSGARCRAGSDRDDARRVGCLCSTMFRISPNHLLWALEGLVDGEVHNRIVVPEPRRHSRASRWIECSNEVLGVRSSHVAFSYRRFRTTLPRSKPHIDAQTMQIHHGKHHAAYVNNLNAALEKHPDCRARAPRI